MDLTLASRVTIAPGVEMPRLGLGTYKSAPPEAYGAVLEALSVGYRGIDTAALYGNEAAIGRAVRDSGVPREAVFVATKVWNDDQGFDSTLAAFERSRRELDLGYVDLYLMHWPVPETFEPTWRAMERLLADGRVRAIGVCNCLEHHLDALAAFADVPPAIDQVEHHPWLAQPPLREYCASRGIAMQAWAPVMRGHAHEEPALVSIGGRHGKSPEQVSLRWILQHGVCALPKSVHAGRIAANADIFDFALSDEEMAEIDAADRGQRLGKSPDDYTWRAR